MQLLTGNHDPNNGINSTWLCNETILVTHGHVALKGVAPWSWRSKYIEEARKYYLQNSGDGFTEQLEATQKASFDAATGEFKKYSPSTIKLFLIAFPAIIQVLLSWVKFPRLMANWAMTYAPSAKFIVTGHTHHAGIWKCNDMTIINTGCYGFPSHPRAVIVDESKIEVYKIQQSGDLFSLGQRLRSWSD